MINNSHRDIVEELPDTPPVVEETPAQDRDLAARASRFSERLAWLPALKESEHFRDRVASLAPSLEAMLKTAEAVIPDASPEDLLWLHENTRLPRGTLSTLRQDPDALRRSPHVRCAQKVTMPRVLAIAADYLQATDYRYSDHTLAVYVSGFQETAPLNMAELWQFAPALKLVLLEEIVERGRKVLNQTSEPQHIGALITSLRDVNEAPWKELLEPLIVFDRVLADDPAHAYARMDFASRELYRNTVAGFAEHSDCSELEIAQLALQMALDAQKQRIRDPRMAWRKAHVGYYLIAEGAEELRRRATVRLPIGHRVQNFLRRHPDEFYLGGIETLTLLIVIAIMTPVFYTFGSFWARIFGILLLVLPSSQAAVEVMNYLTTAVMGPRLLPKLDFAEGIPDDCVTMVAVPTLLMNEKQVRKLVDDLEVRYLGNADKNLHFALLSDLPDSDERPNEEDPLVDLCSELITSLNRKYASNAMGTFALYHRHRAWNPREGVWMGWERKRGKLLDFNRQIEGAFDSFPVKIGDPALLKHVRFVITLDSDTELPRGSAHRLVGAMVHPLNQAIIDPRDNIVVAGYGILQPRVGISVQSAAQSRLASIYSGQTGFDIYTRAISDVYQDLYGEGIFTGKGIYEVETLQKVLEHRFPRNALLSHDLIEGAYARAGLVSDVEVIDDYPSHYSAYNRRKHRWLRGDWQIAEWLLGRVPDETGKRVRNPISFLSRWKIVDNLRRSLVEFGLFLLFVLGWTVLPGRPIYWTLVGIGILFVPPWFQLAFGLARALLSMSLAAVRDAFEGLGTALVGVFLTLVFLAHQALLSADAVLRTLYRRMVSRERLLEWETAAEAEMGTRKTPVDVLLSWTPALSLIVGMVVYWSHRNGLRVALPILVLWALAKPIAYWLNRPPIPLRKDIKGHDERFVRKLALYTWRYFAAFSTEEHNWLIPDYVQQTPSRVAARLSPTNLGFLLNSRQVAREMGYLTVPEFVAQTKLTIATMNRLSRMRGHFYNWYDTRTLEPDRPRFVSTVDSGNLVASLRTLQYGCLDLMRRPLLNPALLDGYADHLCILSEMKLVPKRVVSAFEEEHPDWIDTLLNGPVDLPAIPDRVANADDATWFRSQTRELNLQFRQTVEDFMPWLLTEYEPLRANPALPLKDTEEMALDALPAYVDELQHALLLAHAGQDVSTEERLRDRLRAQLPAVKTRCQRLLEDLQRIGVQCDEFVRQMDFRFLYDRRRKLLSIGSDAETGKVHAACYDLLPSEARIAAFLAVANDEIPQESWFNLGRTQLAAFGYSVLVSWTGTMFEYLLPGIFMRTYPETLMQRTMQSAVSIQQAYAEEHRIPWGISECAYAKTEANGVYGYRAFGVPEVAIQREEAPRLVVAPYATMLALDFDPPAAIKNLRWMVKKGWLGHYGLYEAADYEPEGRRARRNRYELIRQWMVHHQGMSLLSMANFLQHGIVQRWFHSDPRVQATELLLQERPMRKVKSSVASQRRHRKARSSRAPQGNELSAA